ncbi:MAG: carboxypeptidase regulatory-like domain-containing protein, partial [Opitutaceae bacterium]
MKRNKLLTTLTAIVTFLTGSPASAQNPENAAPESRGNITGRVLNEATGQYLRSAVVTVVGTNISTVAESGGVYTLSGVPAGEVRVAVSFIGLDAAEATVKVQPGQTAVHDFSMSSNADGIVQLGEFRVVTERDADYKALQEKKSALEIKSVMSSDAFGDVSEGNVGEFLKLMPGVQMDYVDADVRSVSIGGLDPKYSLVLMDGVPIASGSSRIATGRTFEFETLSISSISSVELSKTPTPDVAGSALAGVVNLRSKGAFDRKGRQIRWSASAGFNSHHLTFDKTPGPNDKLNRKVQPNVTLEFSDVIFNGRLGVIAGYSFARTLVEQNILTFGHAFDADPANNATEVPPITRATLVDAPKVTDRSNYHLRLDYKFTPNLAGWARIDFSVYKALNNNRNAVLTFGNTVNGPLADSPQQAGVEYSQLSQTTTAGTAVLRNSLFFRKRGQTRTLSTGASYNRGAFRADVQGTFSRSTNSVKMLEYGYFMSGDTAPLANLGLRLDRTASTDSAINITQLSGPDWRNLENYPAGAVPMAYGPDGER